MKILTVCGTRPELIRLSVIIKKLDEVCDHVLVYTNQNYDYNLSGVFFDEMKIRKPDYYLLEEKTSFTDFFSNAITVFDEILFDEKPDKVLILGDTNTGLLAIVCQKRGVPVYHLEAGNRCFDERLPEEANRRIIDSVSKYNLCYTEQSKQNLLNEGYHKNFVFKVGNPIYEVLNTLKEIKHVGKSEFQYVLATFHRTENVDDRETLSNIINALNIISGKIKVKIPLHPRTRDRINIFGLKLSSNIDVLGPMGFNEFVLNEKCASLVITDSGTVQEECCIFGVPCLTIRESTERQETIECGSNILVGTQTKDILSAYETVMKRKFTWKVPEDYLIENVSDTVINILTGK